MKDIGILIQARSTSERLKGKVFLELSTKDKTMSVLEWIFYRLSRSSISIIYYVVPESDHEIIRFLKERNIPFLTGSMEDVRDRYRKAAEFLNLQHIIRATGDNPFVEPLLIEPLIQKYFEYRCDLFSFHHLPLGVGVEIFSYSSLDHDEEEENLQIYKEHVSLHIKKFPQKFKVIHENFQPFENYLQSRNYAGFLPRLTLDEKSDYEVFREIYPYLNSDFTIYDVMDLFLLKQDMFLKNLHVQQRKF